MSKALIIERIHKRTGIVGKPRSTTQTGIERIPDGVRTSQVAHKALTQVKRLVDRDGHDRQIKLAEVRTLRNQTHAISSRVIYRIYKSESDHEVHVYKGEAHKGSRGNYEPTEIR